jgi:hypothetical protein
VEPQLNSDEMLPDLSMPPKVQGAVNGVKVKYVHDTGTSLTIIRQKYVNSEQLIGRAVTCMLADECVTTYPLTCMVMHMCYGVKIGCQRRYEKLNFIYSH